MADKHTVHVTIFHQTYALRVAGDEREVVELAATVDQLMNAVSSRSGTSDSVRVGVLACLHMADRLRTIERELAALKQRVDSKSEEFGALLEKLLSSGPETQSTAATPRSQRAAEPSA